jgi:hypothetical protein
VEGDTESSLLALRLAQCAAAQINANPEVLVPRFIDAVRDLRAKNGNKEAYDVMELAAVDGWDSLRALLLARNDESDLIRSMAPLYAVISQEERLRAIRDLRF